MKDNPETMKRRTQRNRQQAKEKGLSKLEIVDLTEADKKAFKEFQKRSGITKNSEAFKKLIEIASINDNQDYYII